MTIITNDDFWLMWVIQLLFDVVILITIIMQKPSREEIYNGDSGNPSDPITNRATPSGFGPPRQGDTNS